LLAKYLLDKNQLVKFVPDLLIRQHYTRSQTFLNKIQRQKNLRKAFIVNSKKQHLINNKKILIIDDVFTTGATVNNCALILKKSKAKEVLIATIARVVPKN
jgi:predicted amidophosphoribosyltransferase